MVTTGHHSCPWGMALLHTQTVRVPHHNQRAVETTPQHSVRPNEELLSRLRPILHYSLILAKG